MGSPSFLIGALLAALPSDTVGIRPEECSSVKVSESRPPPSWHPALRLLPKAQGSDGKQEAALRLHRTYEITGTCAPRIVAVVGGTIFTDDGRSYYVSYEGGMRLLPDPPEPGPPPVNTPFLDGRPAFVTTRLDEGRYIGAWSSGSSTILATFRDWPGYAPRPFAQAGGVVRAMSYLEGLHGNGGGIAILIQKDGRYTLSFAGWTEGG